MNRLIIIFCLLASVIIVAIIVGLYVFGNNQTPKTDNTDNTAPFCTATPDWSAKTALVGGKVTRPCPDGSIQTATCNSDSSWSLSNCKSCIASDGWSAKTALVGGEVTQPCPTGGIKTATCN